MDQIRKYIDMKKESGSTSGAVVRVPADVAPYIDHSLLKPEATREQIDRLCDEAVKYSFYSVCVNSSWVSICARKLRDTAIKVCSVVGFPLGAMQNRSKGLEAQCAIEDGAQEIDMVINVGFLKSGDLRKVEEDIRAVKRTCRSTTILKVIIETGLLTDDEKVMACQIAKKVGADFVKTCTGFAKGGAKARDIALMRKIVGTKMGVKASGGIRSFQDAKLMIESGATRIGASARVAIVTAEKGQESY